MKPKNFIACSFLVAALAIVLGLTIQHSHTSPPPPLAPEPASAHSPSVPVVPPAPVAQLAAPSPPPTASDPADQPAPAPAPAPPDATGGLKDDPQIAALLAKIRDQREIRRQTLEQNLSQMNDPDNPLQIDLQNRLDELQQPVPPPTDFGQVEFAPGVAVQRPLASGELATLKPTLQPNGLLRLDIEIAPAHPNRYSSPETGGFTDAPFGQPKVFAVGDHAIRIVPLLKSDADSSSAP